MHSPFTKSFTEQQRDRIFEKLHGTKNKVTHIYAPNQKAAATRNRSYSANLAKRISPFMLLSGLLIIVYPFLLVLGKTPFHSEWWGFGALMLTIIYVVLFDFAIWNYFKGKKVNRIWIIELILATAILYFLL